MTTRSGKPTKPPLTEEEIETARSIQAAEEKRLREAALALNNEREKFDRERAESENAIAAAFRDLRENNSSISDMKNEIMREMFSLRREIDAIRNAAPPSPSIPPGQRYFESPTPPPLDRRVAVTEALPQPKISLREATEAVPHYDGSNIPVSRFTRACRRARDIVPPNYEKALTKVIINKLSQRAYAAVEDEPCDTITQLIDLLNGAFGPPNTIAHLRGDLSRIFIGKNEHMLDYIGRTKDLRTAILDAERREHGEVDATVAAEIENLTARSFCDGLPLKFRLQLKSEHLLNPLEAFAFAKSLAKRDELEQQRYDATRRSERVSFNHPTAGGFGSKVIPAGNDTNRHYSGTGNFSPRGRDYDNRRDTANPPPRDRTYHTFENRRYGNYRDQNVNASAPLNRQDEQNAVWCRYCKKPGHEIEVCRKREYNNTRRNESGNAHGPPTHPGANQADNYPRVRPVNPISAEEEETEENPNIEIESQH